MNYVFGGALALLFLACAYRGIFGARLYIWLRLPFVFLGAICFSMAGLNMPIAPPRNEAEETEEVREVESPENPGEPDDLDVKQLWSIKGMTPVDVMNSTMREAKNSSYDPEFDEVEWLQEKESFSDFVRRRRLERAS